MYGLATYLFVPLPESSLWIALALVLRSQVHLICSATWAMLILLLLFQMSPTSSAIWSDKNAQNEKKKCHVLCNWLQIYQTKAELGLVKHLRLWNDVWSELVHFAHHHDGPKFCTLSVAALKTPLTILYFFLAFFSLRETRYWWRWRL